VLRQGVQGISEVITVPGLINCDFADVKAIMGYNGAALMGIGKSTGENRAIEAAKQSISSPLLEVSIDGAKGIMFIVTGGPKLSLHEVAEAAKVITQNGDENAKVIFGANIDESMKDDIKVCVIATGFDNVNSTRLHLEKRAEVQPYSSNRFLKKEPVAPPAASPAPVVQRAAAFAPTRPKREPVAEEALVEEEAPKPSFVKRPVVEAREPQLEAQVAAPAPAGAPAEEDLEIPAFLRRKMM
jgi:cell division GTPase FtsZ